MRACFLQFKIDQFKSEFKKPLHIEDQEILTKRGVYLTLTDELGKHGIGELSNLPGYHQQSFEEDLVQLEGLLAKIIDEPFQFLHFDKSKPLYNLFSLDSFGDCSTTVKFALESALLDWYENRAPEFFQKKVGFDPRGLKLKMNALYVPGEESHSIEALTQYWIKNKITTVKIKIGRQDLAKDIALIQEIQKFGQGKFKLRLDANRGLTIEGLTELCRNIKTSWVEYFEEPFESYGDYFSYDVPKDMALALDESLPAILEQGQFPACLKAWVIKPTTVHGLSETFRLIDQANMLKYYAVISSTYESSYGLKLLKILANYQNQSTPTACGLDTLRYLK